MLWPQLRPADAHGLTESATEAAARAGRTPPGGGTQSGAWDVGGGRATHARSMKERTGTDGAAQARSTKERKDTDGPPEP